MTGFLGASRARFHREKGIAVSGWQGVWGGVGCLVLLLAGCSQSEGTRDRYTGPYPIKVACTTGMVADLVRNVGGPHVEITQLMGAGVDPHLYKASPGDLRILTAADMIFYSGRNLEGKMGDVFVRLARKKPTCAVADGIDDSLVLENEEKHYDPHLWFDVGLWAKGIDVVRDTLATYDPRHKDDYTKNALAYANKLTDLDRWAREELAKVPKEQRVLVTAHDAFRYFGRAYDVEVRGIQGISTESEAGVREINELVEFIAKRKVKAVFVESSVSEKNVQALIEGCRNGHGHTVRIGGELFSDAMGPPGTPEGTYEGMIRHNVSTIVRALQ
jgi:manganese/zinc/iron transport system substrate-binding protein